MEQSLSRKANNHSASQEVPRLLWEPKFYYRVHNRRSAGQEIPRLLWSSKILNCIHKGQPLIRILSQMHLVHTFPSYFSKNHFNIILPSTSRSTKFPFHPFRPKCTYFSLHMRAPHLAHLILLELIMLVIFGKACKLWSSSSCIFLQSPVTYKLYNISLISDKVKVNAKLSLCLNKHHAMKTYWGIGGIPLPILWPRH